MNVELNIDSAAFEQSVMAEFARVKVSCQFKMAEAFQDMAIKNLGDATGEQDRPIKWDGLKEKYAKRIGRSHATLYLDPAEAAIVRAESGKLMESIVISQNNADAAVVSSDCEYAVTHQDGDISRNIPARPFFPIINGEVTSYTTAKCLEACKAEMERSLR